MAVHVGVQMLELFTSARRYEERSLRKRDREAPFDQVWLRVSNIYKERNIKAQLIRHRWKQVV